MPRSGWVVGYTEVIQDGHRADQYPEADHAEEEALSKLDSQFGTLFHTQDFLEGRKAEAKGRKPVYQGK